MISRWLEQNTFHYSKFSDIAHLVALKKKKGYTISLCLPTLNEERTIAKEIVILRSELMIRYPLIDEIVVVDSGSTDQTCSIAESFGANVYLADEILSDLEPYTGKGENLWKALFITRGDIIIYIDADIKNIHHRFAYGLLGPLLHYDHIKYAKAFYDRPIADEQSQVRATGGGRVTELVIRPLFALFFPELTQIIQPLSGEYAGFREIFEEIPFPIGYGVETSMILDIYENWGLDVIAQVDLEKRVHRNQDTKALGRMAFSILKIFFQRINDQGIIDIKGDVYDEMIQFHLIEDEYKPSIHNFPIYERPPMITISEYRAIFNDVAKQTPKVIGFEAP